MLTRRAEGLKEWCDWAWVECGLGFPVWASGKEVGFGVESGGAVFDVIFMVVDVFRPPDVILGEGTGCLKVLECLVIGVNGERRLTGFEIYSPLADSLDDG